MEPVPVFILFMDDQGNRKWNSKLPVPLLNLALDLVKQDLLIGKTTANDPAIVPPTNGDISHISRVRP